MTALAGARARGTWRSGACDSAVKAGGCKQASVAQETEPQIARACPRCTHAPSHPHSGGHAWLCLALPGRSGASPLVSQHRAAGKALCGLFNSRHRRLRDVIEQRRRLAGRGADVPVHRAPLPLRKPREWPPPPCGPPGSHDLSGSAAAAWPASGQAWPRVGVQSRALAAALTGMRRARLALRGATALGLFCVALGTDLGRSLHGEKLRPAARSRALSAVARPPRDRD